MNREANRRDHDDLESLVLAYLEGEQRAVDPVKILAGVRSRGATPSRRSGRSFGSGAIRIATRWAAGVAAATLLMSFFWTVRQSSARADAVKLVREAKAVLDQAPVDRSYRVGIELAPGMAERSPWLTALAGFDCRLWTRSDRFWIEGRRSDQVWACGRDPIRHAWLAPTPRAGLDYSPDEAPDQLGDALDLFTLDINTVLHLMATEFDVTPLGEASEADPDVTSIRGTPRAGHPRPRLRSVTVEIDTRSKIVRRIVFSRLREGRPVGDVSFTFDGSGHQPDSAYELAGHLDPNAPVFGFDRRPRRRRELLRFFGSLLTKGE